MLLYGATSITIAENGSNRKRKSARLVVHEQLSTAQIYHSLSQPADPHLVAIDNRISRGICIKNVEVPQDIAIARINTVILTRSVNQNCALCTNGRGKR